MSSPKSDIFLISPNFLSLKSLGNSWGNSYNEFVILPLIPSFSAHPNLVRTQIEIISDPNYLVRILFEK